MAVLTRPGPPKFPRLPTNQTSLGEPVWGQVYVIKIKRHDRRMPKLWERARNSWNGGDEKEPRNARVAETSKQKQVVHILNSKYLSAGAAPNYNA